MKYSIFITLLFRALKPVLFLSFLVLGRHSVVAQTSVLEKKISVTFNGESLADALTKIESIANCSFSYAPEALGDDRSIVKNYAQTSLRDILTELLIEYEIYYRVRGTTILIQTDARNGQVSGKITDQNGNALPFVSVVLKGTRMGGSSDEEGNFSFYAPEGEYSIIASSVGFGTFSYRVTIVPDETLTIKFTLQPSTESLQEVVVQGRREYLYREESTSVLGTNTKLAEIPATINIITSDLLEDVRAYDIEDAVTYVPGVITGGFSGGTNATFYIRGFQNSATFFNGLRQFRFLQQTPSLDNIERVEIVKGPSGANFGVADAGGILNFVTFKPQKEFSARVFTGFGDFGFRRIGGDITGPIDRKKKLTYRFIGSYAERAEWRPGRPNRTPRLTIAPSLAWNYAEGGNLLVEFQHTYTDEPLDRGIFYMEGAGFENNFAPREFSGSQKENTQPISTNRFDINLTQKLGEIFSLEVTYQRMDETGNNELQFMWADARGSYAEDGLTFNGNPTAVYIAPRDEDTERDIDNISAALLANFKTGVFENDLKFGYQYSNATFNSDFTGNGGPGRRNISNTIDIFNPDNDQEFIFTERNNARFFQLQQKFSSFFGQWSANIGTKLRVIAAARYDDVEFFSRFDTADGLGTPSLNISEEVSFRLAGSYDITQSISAFAGYSDSYTPQGGITADGDAIEPLHNIGYEVGLKIELFKNNVLWSNTFFSTTQDNISAVDPNDDMFVIPFGEVRIQGFESEFIGSISKYFDISAGITLQDSENIRTENEEDEGNEFFGVPNVQITAFGAYNLEKILPNFRARLGIIYMGEREGNGLNNFQLPGFTRFDLGLSYVLNKNTTLDVFVENLFDETYYEQTQGRTVPSLGIIPGDRRLIQFNITHQF